MTGKERMAEAEEVRRAKEAKKIYEEVHTDKKIKWGMKFTGICFNCLLVVATGGIWLLIWLYMYGIGDVMKKKNKEKYDWYKKHGYYDNIDDYPA